MSVQPLKPNDRLPPPYGFLIDRNQAVRFSFENREVMGYHGDTIASALLGCGQWLMSRSFKYHRPRGPLTMAGQDANTLVQLPSSPNTLADKQPITNGCSVKAQNYTGSLWRDWQSLTGLFSRFLPVGFYYKAFFRPRGIWEFWARFIRSQAGLGIIDQSFRPAYFDKQYKFADVTVVGGGPAGLSAALAAAESGVEVLLLDENPVLGGSLNYSAENSVPDKPGSTASNSANRALRDKLLSEIAATENIQVMCGATCNSWHADNWLAVVSGNRLYKLRTAELIVCAGSLEQQAVFRGNDLPGVLMSSAAQRLVHLYAVVPGRSVLVLTGNDLGYQHALDLLQAGISVKAVVDMRPDPEKAPGYLAFEASNGEIIAGSTVYEAFLDKSKMRVGAVEVRRIRRPGVCQDVGFRIDCDLVSMSVGYMPTYQLICQAGGQLAYQDDCGTFSLNNLPDHFQIAGSVNGKWSTPAVTAEGARAGSVAAARVLGRPEPPAPVIEDELAAKINFHWPMFAHPKGKEFVDYDEDLQLADIVNATLDGYEHIQLVKRYSTCGMGPSQGRHSALAAARLVADATGKTVAETGVTTARPPFAAEKLAHNAGRSFYPARRSNMHYRHVEAGAQMMIAGAWYRPAYYGPESARDELIRQEVENVHNNVGLIDVSTLGGIELRGPDAAEFLNRFYTFTFTKQPVGRSRYALLTNEAGVVIDDGVACRFEEDHFYVTATTGGVDRVYQSMLKWNSQWRLDVDIANATTAWCGVNIAGPKSRSVLAAICDIDLAGDSFPYMGVRQASVDGIPARLMRVGFVGELGFEIHVPQQYGEALWDSLLAAGADVGIKPFGVEAQRVLRLEKGHVIIGQDTDAMSNPMELKMNWAIAAKKPFFVGARSLRDIRGQQQRQLVGFSLAPGEGTRIKESHLVVDQQKMIGRVTSCAYSPTQDKAIGLAYIPVDQAMAGGSIQIKVDDGQLLEARIEALPFYDPENQRQEM